MTDGGAGPRIQATVKYLLKHEGGTDFPVGHRVGPCRQTTDPNVGPTRRFNRLLAEQGADLEIPDLAGYFTGHRRPAAVRGPRVTLGRRIETHRRARKRE